MADSKGYVEKFKDIYFVGIKSNVIQNILRKNWDIEYYNKEEHC
jgi:hypothetical protein